ncbi:hypothetical protein HMPREF9418_2093, partial [Neisseria macacae ATCC 33926]
MHSLHGWLKPVAWALPADNRENFSSFFIYHLRGQSPRYDFITANRRFYTCGFLWVKGRLKQELY